MQQVTIHRHAAGPAGALVNAYLVESADGVVAVDAMLTVSDSRALRARLEALDKPLLGVLVTHAHPDHYGGLVELVAGLDVPVVAVSGVNDVIRRDDAVKEQILRPMFGDEWPRERRFPSETVRDGEVVAFGDLRFTAWDLGPAESPHDSAWLLGDDARTVFLGDQAYNHMHAYLADGFTPEWRRNLDRLRGELPAGATLHVGHGPPATPTLFDWQEGYLDAFASAIAAADFGDPERARAEVVGRMRDYLPSDELQFLMELSIEPAAAAAGSRT